MMWLLLSLAFADPLVVEVHGLSSDQGHVLCTLYDRAETWLSDPGFLATTRVKPAGGTARCDFGERPAGTYAATFLHDLDDDGDMATNWLGLPREPWGITRDPVVRFGPPAFRAASFPWPGEVPSMTAR